LFGVKGKTSFVNTVTIELYNSSNNIGIYLWLLLLLKRKLVYNQFLVKIFFYLAELATMLGFLLNTSLGRDFIRKYQRKYTDWEIKTGLFLLYPRNQG